MPIDSNALINKSAKQLYIIFMSPEERAQALKDKLITQADIDAAGITLTPAEKTELIGTLSMARLLFLITKLSSGRTDMEMEALTNDLEKLNNWINQINSGIDVARNFDADEKGKGVKDPKFTLDKWPKGLQLALNDARKKYRKGTDDPINPNLSENPTIAIGELGHISDFLNSRVRDVTTKVSEQRTDKNSINEMFSFVAKKFTDISQALLRGVS